MYSLLRRVPDPVSPPRPIVAAFDVDGTLTLRDSVRPFLVGFGRRRLAVALARRPLALLSGLVRRDRDALKAIACSSLAGLDEADVRSRGAEYARQIHDRGLREDTVARLHEHRGAGHVVLLVSASLEPYLVPLGELLGVDAVLCTRLESRASRLTGSLDGPNCRGAEKERRLRRWLDERELSAEVWAYGDSAGDDAMLAMADHPVRVGRAPLPPGL